MSLFDRFRRRPSAEWAADSMLAPSLPEGLGAGQLTIGEGLQVALQSPVEARLAQIDGQLSGVLRVQKLSLGRKGHFEGQLRCSQAELRGEFQGELVVKGRLTLYPSARVSGRILCNDVVVWRGASLLAEVQELPPDPRGAARRELATLGAVH